MTSTFHFNRLFIYSEQHSKYFFSEFGDQINLIHGPNTSGKSTLLQSLIYVFGINDVKENLKEILDFNVLFRLDMSIKRGEVKEDISLIRNSGTIYIKQTDQPIKAFYGIDGDSSAEHIKLKMYFHNFFQFNLFLESKDEYKPAPIEVIFLPYYISQAVGWVYLRKSFSSLDYYRNFKDDFLDYYLGIETELDREKKKALEAEILKLQKEQTFFLEMEKNDIPLQVMKIADEEFTVESLRYLKRYKAVQEEVVEKEKEFLMKSNELTFFNERKSVISRIKNNHQKQRPSEDHCPMCEQTLPSSMELEYIHLQEVNDSRNQLKLVNEKIIKLQAEVNSLHKKIEKHKKTINDNYQLFKNYSERNISMESWITSKANIQLEGNIKTKLGEIAIQLAEKSEELKAYKTDEQVALLRNGKSNLFNNYFNRYLSEFRVKPLSEERFTNLYKISAFPFQGVELHETVMAYHFALNNVIYQTQNIHRLPFILDGVFKEDVDDENKNLIIKFVNKNRPKDTQLFFSVAEKTDQPSQINRYKEEYLGNATNLILIGNGKDKRALLQTYEEKENTVLDIYLKDTLDIINNISN